jgi:hypothetical protein
MNEYVQLLRAVHRRAPSPEHSVEVDVLVGDLGWACTKVQDLAEQLAQRGYLDVDAEFGGGVYAVDGLSQLGRQALRRG